MPTLSLKKKDLPFLLAGHGEAAVDTGNLQLGRPIAESTASVLRVSFNASGQQRVSLGSDDSVKVGVSTKANIDLIPLFSTTSGARSELLETYGIGGFFKEGTNSDKVVLCFNLGAAGDVAAAGSFKYSALQASVELDAGADAGYAYLRALNKTDSVERIVPEFFKTMRLPDQGTRAPEPGEAIALQYGGYLRLAAEVSAGYKLAGTKSVSVGQLALSEKYDLSILGKIGLSAGIAGRFSILVTGAEELPGWARVEVRRHRAKDMKIAADVNVAFKNELDGLPPTANEFLGAVLGVNAKNFLTVLKKSIDLPDFKQFEKAIDGLAKKYIEELIGKGFHTLSSQTEFTKFLAKVDRVVKSYERLEDRAITLFDRYFDKLEQLTGFLDKIESAAEGGLEGLRKDLNPELWSTLSQLTDGDPLGFLLQQVTVGGKKVDSRLALKTRAAAVLDLIRNPAHEEIRRAIGLAKQRFGIDTLFGELAKIGTVDGLQALANEKVGLFVTRLVGRTLDSSANVKQAFTEVQAVLAKIDAFPEKLFGAFKEAANSSYRVALHAEYSRASESDSLIDVAINMTDPRGAGLLVQAGKGNFEEVLGMTDTAVVRLREGILTHRTRRESAFNVNIVGWHLNYKYEGFDRVITETSQRLIPSDQGITILTTATLEMERQRKRQDEEMHMNFLLRALGESAHVVKSDEGTAGYLIETLNSLTARYRLNFTDDDTSSMELRDYLGFARDVGLDTKGATLQELDVLLPRAANGGYGKIDASYDIRFGQTALAALLDVKQLSKPGEMAIRNAMRRMVLSNYLKSDEQHDVAFSYATPGVFELFQEEGFAAFANHSQRQFRVKVPNAAIAAPAEVVLDKMELTVLSTLFSIENMLVAAIKDLYKLLNGKTIAPAKFEKSLGKFGDALKEFDRFDQTTSKGEIGTSTVFAMFDMLVRLAAGGNSATTSLLRLKSEAGGTQVEKLFLSDDAAKAI